MRKGNVKISNYGIATNKKNEEQVAFLKVCGFYFPFKCKKGISTEEASVFLDTQVEYTDYYEYLICTFVQLDENDFSNNFNILKQWTVPNRFFH